MDHRTFLAGMEGAVKAALMERSDRAGLWHLAGHLGAIAVCSALILAGVPGWWVAVPVQGVLVVFLFTLEHEATHKTPFASERLNEAVGRAAGLLLVLPFEWFRYFHLAHHRWTNIEGQDPELEGGKPQTRARWLWHVTGLPYWISAARLMVRLCLGQTEEAWMPAAAKARAAREARMMAAVYAAVALSFAWTDAAFWLWILPVLVGQPVLRIYLLAEHGDCPLVADMFRNTRTTFTTRIVRFVAWNMPYHVEHHVLPQVPFYRLPALHGLMKADLAVTAEGYAAFTAEYLARRL